MKKLKRDQRGLTLIELVIVIAITGLITTAITMTVFQVFNMNTRASNRMTAVSQVQHAGKLVSEDILEAQSVNATGGSGFPLTLTWTEVGVSGDAHTIIYTLEDMPSGEFMRLQRKHYIYYPSLNSTITVAEYIDPDETSCAPLGVLPAGGVLTFTVTATVGEQSETRVYEVKPRPGSY